MLVTCNLCVYVCVCARANPQLAAALNEQSGFGMHRSLLLCALQQAPERKWWKGSVCVCVWKLLNSSRFGKWKLEKRCIIWKGTRNKKKCLSSGNLLKQTNDYNRQLLKTSEKTSKSSRDNDPRAETPECSVRPEGRGDFANRCWISTSFWWIFL